jgi:hypothetical protein
MVLATGQCNPPLPPNPKEFVATQYLCWDDATVCPPRAPAKARATACRIRALECKSLVAPKQNCLQKLLNGNFARYDAETPWLRQPHASFR